MRARKTDATIRGRKKNKRAKNKNKLELTAYAEYICNLAVIIL